MDALLDKSFEQEAERSRNQAEAEGEKEALDAESSMEEAEAYLVSLMETSEAKLVAFEKTAATKTESEMQSLIREAKLVNKAGELMGKTTDFYSNKYIDTALTLATASMKSAWSDFSAGCSRSNVFPS